MMRRIFLIPLVLAAAMAGCEGPPPEAYIAGGDKSASKTAAAVPVGTNEAGESCRYQLTSATSEGVASQRDALVYCGKWDQPSGRIFDLGGEGSVGSPASLASSGSWRNYVSQRFDCGAPSASRFAGGSAEIMQCTRRLGGWPHVALTVSVGGHVFGADAVRPALPALEAALASLTGQAVPAAAGVPRSEGERLIAQRTVGGSFGSGDEGRFFQLTQLGDAYNNRDDAADAEASYREALAIQQKILGPNDPGLALTMMKLAAQISHLTNAPEAEKLLARAGELVAKKPDPLLTAQLDYYRAVASAYQGKRQEALAQAQVAEAAFAKLVPDALARTSAPKVTQQEAFAEVMRESSANNTPERTAISGLAESMRLRATLLLNAGKRDEAAALAQRAEKLLAANGLNLSSTAARSLRLLATNQAIAGDYSNAASIGGQATRVFDQVVPDTRPDAESLLRQGAYQARARNLSGARDSFHKAGVILAKASYQGDTSVPPELILPWLDSLQGEASSSQAAAEMFQAAQLGETGQTAALISQATARLIAGDPKVADTIRAFEDRKRELQQLQTERDRAVAAGGSGEQVAAIDKRIDAASQAQKEAEEAILNTPGYTKAVEKPATLAELQKLLAPDEAFALFFVAKEGSYGFIVRQNNVAAYRMGLTGADISDLINRLRDSTIVTPGGLPKLDFAAGYKLYSALFGPAESLLQGVNRITVAANGDLLRYPLEALVTQSGVTVDGGDYRKVPFLVRRFAIAYVPSPRMLVNIRAKRETTAGLRPFIGFGDFQPASAAQLAASFPPDRCRDDLQAVEGLHRLPDTRIQVTQIAQQLGAGAGGAVTGDAFTKQRLAASDVSNSRIVLLATHAFLPSSLRCLTEPAITVSAARAGNADSEFLRVADIEKLKLHADLVALSACNTAGSGGTGESLSGLARAFFQAGAHGLLVTHWNVVTGASVPLMVGTFGNGSADSAQALRAAQIKMIDSAGSSPQAPVEISHPNYWAAFILIGDGVRGQPGA